MKKVLIRLSFAVLFVFLFANFSYAADITCQGIGMYRESKITCNGDTQVCGTNENNGYPTCNGKASSSSSSLLSTNDLSPSNSGLKVPDKPATLIKNVINIVFVIAAVLTFAYLIWGAISWITSGGDKSKVESARNKITSAVIGLLILAATWALFSLVMQVAFGQDMDLPSHVVG